MVEIYNKIRDCSEVKMHGWYNSSVGIIRKPNSSIKESKVVNQTIEPEPKVQETKQNKIMKKLLLILPADKKLNRIIRRGVVVAILTLIAFIGQETFVNYGYYVPTIWAPVVSGILAALDKTLRELKEK